VASLRFAKLFQTPVVLTIFVITNSKSHILLHEVGQNQLTLKSYNTSRQLIVTMDVSLLHTLEHTVARCATWTQNPHSTPTGARHCRQSQCYNPSGIHHSAGEVPVQFQHALQVLTVTPDDWRDLLGEEGEFQALQKSLRARGAITNLVVQQGIHFYIKNRRDRRHNQHLHRPATRGRRGGSSCCCGCDDDSARRQSSNSSISNSAWSTTGSTTSSSDIDESSRRGELLVGFRRDRGELLVDFHH